ncbi:MAG: site-2 protease family protein [Candidatus Saganbacteria bacterium]|nr:site-2 protease family protein [Candidatus Saganbacteria bacterium]
MLTVFSFLFLFLVITLVHEFGHLVMAKRAGIRVYEFSIGLGPIIFQTIRSNTKYSLRAIPVGGFVRIAGMGADKEDASCPPEEQYQYKSLGKNFILLLLARS